MTDHLYDALEICLQSLEQGAELEACLARFPALADELRPVLEAAVQARSGAVAVKEIPAEAMRRGRARVLQHAAGLRERNRQVGVLRGRRPWQTGRAFRFFATSLAALVFLFSGGTGLVFAASGSLPGDNLYPVKRRWEDVQLVFIFDPGIKSQREMEFEHERVNEIHDLFSESRQTQVDFQGVVEWQQAGTWQVAGLRIAIDHDATIKGEILPGALVQVTGETENGIIQAEQINLLQAAPATPTAIPTLRPLPSRTVEPEKTQEATEQLDGQDDRGDRTPQVEDTQESGQAGTSGSGEPAKTPKADDHSGSGGSDGGGGGGGGGGGDDGGDH